MTYAIVAQLNPSQTQWQSPFHTNVQYTQLTRIPACTVHSTSRTISFLKVANAMKGKWTGENIRDAKNNQRRSKRPCHGENRIHSKKNAWVNCPWSNSDAKDVYPMQCKKNRTLFRIRIEYARCVSRQMRLHYMQFKQAKCTHFQHSFCLNVPLHIFYLRQLSIRRRTKCAT